MCEKESYTGIDCFRLIAALLVISIHTSPLQSYSLTGDLILTRILARVAVPFFFMTSGFFTVSRYSRSAARLVATLKKTAVIYGFAILLCLPVNFYTGYFKTENLLPELIQDLVFDGTMYHLWYLPAVMIGAVIAWYLVKKLDYRGALAVTGVLYLIGLFGDSYYGLVRNVAGISRFYDLMFQVSDYTRNGIFFAPVFLVLGGLAADSRRNIPFPLALPGLVLSFALMTAEAMTLHFFGVPRHDSMYVFLPLCMYFLFACLRHFRGKRFLWMRTASLLIYILHPLVILAVRGAAKLFSLQGLLVENSLVHFLAVCAGTLLFSIPVSVLWEKRRLRTGRRRTVESRVWVEINLENLEHNVCVLTRELPPECRLMAVVKAEAYGHGAFEIAVHLEKIGVRAFAVATADEAIALRKYGIRGEILILGYTDVCRARELQKYRLTQTLIDFSYADALNRQKVPIRTHIKIDTGMHRLGMDCEDVAAVKKVFSMKHIKVTGIFTHFCCAESLWQEDIAFTRAQIAHFLRLTDLLRQEGITLPKIHVQSSYGLLNYPGLSCDYVRVGIALYGVHSAPGEYTVLRPDLRPVLSLKSKVVLIRTVKAGESVGYDRCFTAKRDSRIAMIPVGYGDGYPRSLSCGKGKVFVGGHCVPVVGRVCMDQLAVDITGCGGISVGDTVTLIGGEEEISAPVVAECAGSISNELLCRIGTRVPVTVRKP